jgi:hypothetical protein
VGVDIELLDGVSSSPSLDEARNCHVVQEHVEPELHLSERRPLATDEGGRLEESISLLTSLVGWRGWVSDGDDAPDCLERQVVDGRCAGREEGVAG